MFLKPQIDIISFLKQVDLCKGQVSLRTAMGDVLDLKSELCRCLFVTAYARENGMPLAEVLCETDDYELIGEYLTEE